MEKKPPGQKEYYRLRGGIGVHEEQQGSPVWPEQNDGGGGGGVCSERQLSTGSCRAWSAMARTLDFTPLEGYTQSSETSSVCPVIIQLKWDGG